MWSPTDGDPRGNAANEVGNGVVSKVGNGTDVVVMDNRLASMSAGPIVSHLNVTKSSKVHVGPKIVSVTQNVQNAEMIKGHILGLELVSTKHSRRVRCSVAVFICWALLVASGLIVCVVYFALPKPTRLDIGLNETWYLRRDEWQALPSYGEEFLQLPVPYVIISHSALSSCVSKFECVERVYLIQQIHFKLHNNDIGPNFLVGGDGWVFEGRGANVVGAVYPEYNRRSISIMFLGNYENDNPNPLQLNHTNILIDTLLERGVLRPDFILWGQCQVNPDTVSPGPNLVKHLKELHHWNPANTTGCPHN